MPDAAPTPDVVADVVADAAADVPEAGMPAPVVAAFDRQRQIWTNLYGPVRAGALVDAAVERRAERPDLEVRDLFAALDPERDEDYVDFVATRW